MLPPLILMYVRVSSELFALTKMRILSNDIWTYKSCVNNSDDIRLYISAGYHLYTYISANIVWVVCTYALYIVAIHMSIYGCPCPFLTEFDCTHSVGIRLRVRFRFRVTPMMSWLPANKHMLMLEIQTSVINSGKRWTVLQLVTEISVTD